MTRYTLSEPGICLLCSCRTHTAGMICDGCIRRHNLRHSDPGLDTVEIDELLRQDYLGENIEPAPQKDEQPTDISWAEFVFWIAAAVIALGVGAVAVWGLGGGAS